MGFETAYRTDIGRRDINQDGLLVKVAKTPLGTIGLFMICDGMGGLSNGELASATVIQYMGKWFAKVLPVSIKKGADEIASSLEQAIGRVHQELYAYGHQRGMELGTTVSGMLFVQDAYYLFHVGDSRVYSVTKDVAQLTQDHTMAEREVRCGNLSVEEAKIDPRCHVLWQCLGATPTLKVAMKKGKVKEDVVFLLCTDGFYRKLEENDLKRLQPEQLDKSNMSHVLEELTTLVKQRQEQDNISAIVVKVMKERR